VNGARCADYGWNLREGHCVNGTTDRCQRAAAGITEPIFDYPHENGCGAITGGAFVPRGVWPEALEGAWRITHAVDGRPQRIGKLQLSAASRSAMMATAMWSRSIRSSSSSTSV
jgi:hypothetical protein